MPFSGNYSYQVSGAGRFLLNARFSQADTAAESSNDLMASASSSRMSKTVYNFVICIRS